MDKRWVIGDIHGCSRTLKQLIEKLSPTQTDQLYLLGDYINKGPDSKGVVEYITQLRTKGLQVSTLWGNHEEMFITSLYDERLRSRFLMLSDGKLLENFGVERLEEIPRLYPTFFSQLEYFLALDDYVLVHAGMNFNQSDPFQDKHAMLWSRHYSVQPHKIHHRILVHGHTPTKLASIQRQLEEEQPLSINLDNGCVYTEREDMGNLLALELSSRQLVIQKNSDQ